MPDSNPQRLRALVDGPGMAVLPGAYDGLSARLVARAGFEAVYFSGGLSASSFPGMPDFGTRTHERFEHQARWNDFGHAITENHAVVLGIEGDLFDGKGLLHGRDHRVEILLSEGAGDV